MENVFYHTPDYFRLFEQANGRRRRMNTTTRASSEMDGSVLLDPCVKLAHVTKLDGGWMDERRIEMRWTADALSVIRARDSRR